MNPELTNWSGRFGLPRFDLIHDADFAPAFDAALAGVAANPAREALQRDLAVKLSAHTSRVMMDSALYARIKAVQDEGTALDAQQQRLVTLSLRGMRRAGAGLPPEQRIRMAEVQSRLAVLSTQFAQNVLADEREFFLSIPDDRLGGLPDWLIGAMRAAARERGQAGQVVTLSRSLVVPFLEYSTDRALREAAWRAWTARGSGTGAGGAATDNTGIAAEILALRHERAQMLGYPDFASFKLEPEMAGTPERVEDLLREVWEAALLRVREDEAALTARLHADGVNGALEPWDWRHYAEMLRRDEHDLDEAEVKPYLTLDAMIGAVFDVASRLFKLTFERFDAPLWHDDVRAWRVLRDGREMAVFLGDYFARPGKRSGAWCSSLQSQHHQAGGQRAIVVNVCNFTPPDAAGEPAFLSWDDAHTLFHEFGHALHHILSDVDWPSISATSVARDFVELPSQLFEHWLEQPAVLDAHARHYQTGAAMPADLRDRVIAAGNAGQGFATTEYLESALVDLAFHRGTPPADPMARQAEVLKKLGGPAAVPMRHATPHFAHVFAGDGYSSGYYSYMWSEVMDADAFAAFTETGDVFDPETASRLERTILSRGGSAPADQLWTDFRERMPGVRALLMGRGLGTATVTEGKRK